MKITWFLIALTIVNLGLLLYTLGQIRPAAAESVAPVLRGRALQIVDDHGRVRASIKVQPATIANGKAYPENVILRLIDPNNVTLKAEGADSSLKMTNKAGRQQLIKP